MSSGEVILFLFCGAVSLVAVTTLFLFRFFGRLLGLKEVHNEGVVIAENGLEVLAFGIAKNTIRYADVERVELLHYKGPAALLVFRYGLSARWIGTRLFHEIVVIKIKGPHLFKYLLATPKNGVAFVDQLKSRIGSSQGTDSPTPIRT